MDTQNTPVHLKLWHREFWMLALANLLLMMSAYGLLPTLPFYLLGRGLDGMQTGLVMGIYGAGLFAWAGSALIMFSAIVATMYASTPSWAWCSVWAWLII